MERFLFIEWDEVKLPGFDASGYKLVVGLVQVPFAPGYGLELDDNYFSKAVEATGWFIKV
ncbi:hypothetical protein EFBL_1455 [Effusibacillus lacus]|uniref:Uncharacterized protein n=1 Tax=Effusibacillus lacus TaxID=1348429 RepID=A0A292YMY3_9BACL|nr:hypothetical protein EFBL_1455 [Effusibacillus lacus]